MSDTPLEVRAIARSFLLHSDGEAASQQRHELSRLFGTSSESSRLLNVIVARRNNLLGSDRRDGLRVEVDTVAVAGDVSTLIARGELLISSADRTASALLEPLGFELIGEQPQTGIQRFRNLGATADDIVRISRALRDLGVSAGPNHFTATSQPKMKGVEGLGGPRRTELNLGDAPPRSGSPVTVAVVDTGIDRAAVSEQHGWLSGIAVHDGPTGNVDLLDSVPVPDGYLDDGAGHGTFVAGVIRQVEPRANLMAVRALDSDGGGTEFSLGEALCELADSVPTPDVINVSLGSVTVDDLPPIGMEQALVYLWSKSPSTVVVAAAGNESDTRPCWPAANKNVVAVGSLDKDGRKSVFSNHGWWVDFWACGEGIVSTYVKGKRLTGSPDDAEPPTVTMHDGDYAAWTGTSFSAPQVSGVLAAAIADGLSPAEALASLRASSRRLAHGGYSLDTTVTVV